MKSACVIVAAGEGSRLGGVNKALLRTGTASFLSVITTSLRASGCSSIVVVSAQPHAAETEAEALRLGLHSVRNPDPKRGMASSVSVGFDYATANFTELAAWLWPVDAPGVSPETLSALQSAGGPDTITTPSYLGRGGHPSLVGRSLWAQLVDCVSRSEGARSVFRAPTTRRTFVNVDDAAVVRDIDVAADLGTLEARDA